MDEVLFFELGGGQIHQGQFWGATLYWVHYPDRTYQAFDTWPEALRALLEVVA